ncbi:MAG TPA: cell division protein FtsA [Syntrophomonadaceae bacterium]|nr:cell division protein FtsA [Syntrophomonadaceae bacterium]
MDVGTSYIKAAMAELNFGQDINLLGVSKVPARGLRKGNIIDIESTAKSIEECLNELERLTGVEINSALFGFSGGSITAINNQAVVAVGNPTYEITRDDRDRVLQSSRNVALPPDKTIVQTIERQYIVDGYEGVNDPVGMVGSRLEAEVTVVIAATAAIQNLYRCANRINLHINQLVYSPLLAAEAVLIPAEKEMGVVLVDLGGGTTEIAFYENGSLSNTSVLPMGDEYLAKDLAIVLKTSMEEANRILEKSAVANPKMAQEDLIINVRNIQGKDIKQVPQEVIAEIISARLLEIVELIYEELKQYDCLNRMPSGLVLTGGGAELPGISELFEQYLDMPVRVGLPENMRGMAREFNRSQNGNVLGGILYSTRIPGVQPKEASVFSGFFDRFIDWFKDIFR